MALIASAGAMVRPTESQIQIALRAFLLDVLPAGIEIVVAQANMVSEVAASDFILMTPTIRKRLATNEDKYADCAFTGAIAGTALTAASVSYGAIILGATVYGANIAASTTITALGSGTGGAGTYTVSTPQTVAAERMASGTGKITQRTMITYQLDVHGNNSGDNCQIITTMFRDTYAYQFFLNQGFNVFPLYADDARQVPFVNGEQQFENRWTIDMTMEAPSSVLIPQQFAENISATLVDVITSYPA
jgi:hypothetical protein